MDILISLTLDKQLEHKVNLLPVLYYLFTAGSVTFLTLFSFSNVFSVNFFSGWKKSFPVSKRLSMKTFLAAAPAFSALRRSLVFLSVTVAPD